MLKPIPDQFSVGLRHFHFKNTKLIIKQLLPVISQNCPQSNAIFLDGYEVIAWLIFTCEDRERTANARVPMFHYGTIEPCSILLYRETMNFTRFWIY